MFYILTYCFSRTNNVHVCFIVLETQRLEGEIRGFVITNTKACTWKKCPTETVLLSIYNICFNKEVCLIKTPLLISKSVDFNAHPSVF